MSWYDDAYLYRAPISFPEDASAGDLQVTIPTDWDLFWGAIQSDGDDVLVTLSNGITLVTFEVSSFTYASRIMVLDIDQASYSGDVRVLWLYFGNSAGTSLAGSFVQAGMDTGYVELAQPDGVVLQVQSEAPGATVPSQQFAKAAAADLFVWWRVSGLLRRRTRYNESASLEEVQAVNCTVYTGGAAQAGMTDDSLLRVVETEDGDTYVRMYVDDGTTATYYTVEVVVTTSYGRALVARALMYVKDVAEP